MDKRYYFGIDIGGTTVKTGIFSAEGVLLEKSEIATRTGQGEEAIFGDIAAELSRLAHANGAELSECAAGIDIAGPVDEEGFMERGVNLGLDELYPARILSDMCGGMPSFALNDANAAALGEIWQGGGRGVSSAVMITLGTGVGGGVIQGGRVISGTHGLGGEIGHICVEPGEEELCSCGGRGCLEQYASATGIVRMARRVMAESEEYSGMRVTDPLTAKDVFDLAKEGDALAVLAADESMDRLGRAMAMICYVTDPESIIIGGGVSRAGEYLRALAQSKMEKYARLSKHYPKVVLAELGNDAGICGAAKYAMDMTAKQTEAPECGR